MRAELPKRPRGDTIDVTDPKAARAWAAWLDVDQSQLLRVVRIAGASAGQVEYLLGKTKRSRF